MIKKLSHEFIAARVKHDKIECLKNINFWGNDLEEVSILQQMQNLEVISLSVNKIKTLKDFNNLKNLRELYLRKNQISDLNEIKYLSTCPNLRILWIGENPIAEIKNNRLIVIGLLPSLEILDDNVINKEERLRTLDLVDYNNNNNQAQEKQIDEKEDFYNKGILKGQLKEYDFNDKDSNKDKDKDNSFDNNNLNKNKSSDIVNKNKKENKKEKENKKGEITRKNFLTTKKN